MGLRTPRPARLIMRFNKVYVICACAHVSLADASLANAFTWMRRLQMLLHECTFSYGTVRLFARLLSGVHVYYTCTQKRTTEGAFSKRKTAYSPKVS
jgi:hypothetical protein